MAILPGTRTLMAEVRKKKCRICGLADGHTLMHCPNGCGFCGDSITRCLCLDSSLVRGVIDSETSGKSTSKRNVEHRDLDNR